MKLGKAEDILGFLVHPQGMGISIFDLERLTLSRICYWYQRLDDINETINKEANKK